MESHFGLTVAGSKPDAEEAFRGRRILLAEDNGINAMIAVEILNNMGAEVEVADDGQKSVDSFCAHPAGYYNFILVDVQMPERFLFLLCPQMLLWRMRDCP